MYCKVCGKELPRGARRCDECGTPVDGAAPESGSYSQENQEYRGSSDDGRSFDTGDGYYQDNRDRYNSYHYDGGQEPVYERQSGARKGFAIASMVLGIIGLVGSCCSLVTFGILSILLGIIGLIFGILGLKSENKGMAIAGIIMAGLNIVIGILLMILMIASMQMTGELSPEELEQMEKQLETMYGVEMIRFKNTLLR